MIVASIFLSIMSVSCIESAILKPLVIVTPRERIQLSSDDSFVLRSSLPHINTYLKAGQYNNESVDYYSIFCTDCPVAPEIATVIDFLKVASSNQRNTQYLETFIASSDDTKIAQTARVARALHADDFVANIHPYWPWKLYTDEGIVSVPDRDFLNLVKESDVIAMQFQCNREAKRPDMQSRLWSEREQKAENNAIHLNFLNLPITVSLCKTLLRLLGQFSNAEHNIPQQVVALDDFFYREQPETLGNILSLSDALHIAHLQLVCNVCNVGSNNWADHAPFFSIKEKDKQELIAHNRALHKIANDTAYRLGGHQERNVWVGALVKGLQWSPRGTYLTVHTQDQGTWIYADLDQGPIKKIDHTHDEVISTWDPFEGSIALADGKQETLTWFDLFTKKMGHYNTGHANKALSITPEKRIICGGDGITIFEPETGKEYYLSRLSGISCCSLAHHPTDPAFVVGTDKGNLFLINSHDNTILKTMSGCQGIIKNLVYSNTGQLAIYTQCASRNELFIWGKKRHDMVDTSIKEECFKNIYFDNDTLHYMKTNNTRTEKKYTDHLLIAYDVTTETRIPYGTMCTDCIAVNQWSKLAKADYSRITLYPSREEQKQVMHANVSLGHCALWSCADSDGSLSQAIIGNSYEKLSPAQQLVYCLIQRALLRSRSEASRAAA